MATLKALALSGSLILQYLFTAHGFSFLRAGVPSVIERAGIITVIIVANALVYVLWRCLIRPRFSILRDLPQPPVR